MTIKFKKNGIHFILILIFLSSYASAQVYLYFPLLEKTPDDFSSAY